MNNKLWLIGLGILVIIIGLSIWGFRKVGRPAAPQISGQEQTTYFAEDAKVMYFWSENCSWCQKEKKVLERLGAEGYRVKSMDVLANSNLWQEYSIKGTPTFIAQNGDRLVGYQEYEVLKPWLESHR